MTTAVEVKLLPVMVIWNPAPGRGRTRVQAGDGGRRQRIDDDVEIGSHRLRRGRGVFGLHPEGKIPQDRGHAADQTGAGKTQPRRQTLRIGTADRHPGHFPRAPR